MVSTFYKLQFRIGCNKICTLWNKCVKLFLGWYYPIWVTKHPLNTKYSLTGDEKLIVSLTSFPARIPQLVLCMESLFRQTLKPGKIILWLSEEQFCDKKIPKELERFTKYGLEVRFCIDDLKPHKKLIYSMMEYPQSVIITVDDDIIYSENLVSELFIAHQKHSEDVCCNMAHEILLKEDGMPDLYDNWNGGSVGKEGSSDLFCAIGVGGVLYPPNCFNSQYFDLEKIKKTCLFTDDLWLKFNEIIDCRKVYKIKKHSKIPFEVPGSQKSALTHINNGVEKRNDTALRLLQDEFTISWKALS